jgi:hypothetical protein
MMTTTDTTTPAKGTNATPPAASPPPAVAPPPQPASAALVHMTGPQAPHSDARAAFELAQRRAKVLSQSTLVPEAYRGLDGLANCMIALNLADRIGADPFAVIQNLDIIHGRPGLRATFLIATVNACGRFTPLRYRFEGKVGADEWGARAVATDRDSGDELVGALITIAMAKAEGWATKNGSKWRTMPEQMLMYRAASFWTRVYAPELSLGIQTSEEVSDVTGVAMTDLPLITTSSTKALTERLMARPAASPDAVIVPASDPQVAPSTAPTIAPEASAEPPVEAKPTKKSGKASHASLPTGNLLPIEPPKPNEPERDPNTGEIVPPMREPGDDTEELGE